MVQALRSQPVRPEIGIGLLGCGVVGSAVARSVVRHAARLERRLGARPVFRRVAVRHPDKPRDVPLRRALFTGDALEVVERDDVDVVIELIGGVNPAGALVELALAAGKPVVTANKELLARRWDCLVGAARAKGRTLLFEGSVMAGVPVVETLSRLASTDRVERLEGILNGTTNHCLHRMEEGRSLEEALAEAAALGYTELDPSADVEGADPAAKLAILATLAFGRTVTLDDVGYVGIRGLRPEDLAEARRNGETIRLLAEARPVGEELLVTVAPRRLPAGHPLARVNGHHNGLLVHTTLAGPVLIQGPGAGGEATASAVLRDLAAVAAPSAHVVDARWG